MFDYAKIKQELEQLKCPVHGATARVNFIEGKISVENACCEEHKMRLIQTEPEIEDRLEMDELEEIMEEIFYE
jgi:hypothetical protein